MSEFDLNMSNSEMMDFEDLEDELARVEAATLQARVIEEQGRDILRSIMALDAGISPARRLRVQKQRLTKLRTLLSSGALSAPLREPVGEEHLKLMQFYNTVVRPQESIEFIQAPEEARTDSDSDEDDTESMSEDDRDSVIVISSDEEYEPEDEATARANELREAYFSRETDSESEDEDRFKNLNVHYI